MKKLSVWFDGKNETNTNELFNIDNDNMNEHDDIGLIDAKEQVDLVPESITGNGLQERHLLDYKLNRMTAAQTRNKNMVNMNCNYNIQPIFASKNENLGILAATETSRGMIKQLVVNSNKEEGGPIDTPPGRPPEKNSTKKQPKMKPQTPEFQKILRRIKEKRRVKESKSSGIDVVENLVGGPNRAMLRKQKL